MSNLFMTASSFEIHTYERACNLERSAILIVDCKKFRNVYPKLIFFPFFLIIQSTDKIKKSRGRCLNYVRIL